MVQRMDSGSLRGIVHAAAGADKFSLERFVPGSRLRPFVDHYWVVWYDLAPGESHTQRVLSYPNVHLAFEQDADGRRALVYGIPRRPFVRKLQGAGITLGVRFRAGCFYPFWRKDVALLTGRTVAAREVFGPDADRWLAAVLDAEPGAEPDEARNTVPGAWCNTVLDPRFEPAKAAAMARAAEAALLTQLPDVDPRAELAADIVGLAMEDRTIIKVEQLAERTGMSVRALQRLFHRYVGVTPKWVIKRFRLQEAAERIERDAAASWTELAAELGYFDQAHFIKDFKAVLGQTPAQYRAAGQVSGGTQPR